MNNFYVLLLKIKWNSKKKQRSYIRGLDKTKLAFLLLSNNWCKKWEIL